MGKRILSRDGNVLRVDFRAPYVDLGTWPAKPTTFTEYTIRAEEIEAAIREERRAKPLRLDGLYPPTPPPKRGA